MPAAIRDGELICNGIPEESLQKHLLNTEHLASQTEQQEVNEVKCLDCVCVVALVQRSSSISVMMEQLSRKPISSLCVKVIACLISDTLAH